MPQSTNTSSASKDFSQWFFLSLESEELACLITAVAHEQRQSIHFEQCLSVLLPFRQRD
jgi:hypothetical protein